MGGGTIFYRITLTTGAGETGLFALESGFVPAGERTEPKYRAVCLATPLSELRQHVSYAEVYAEVVEEAKKLTSEKITATVSTVRHFTP